MRGTTEELKLIVMALIELGLTQKEIINYISNAL